MTTTTTTFIRAALALVALALVACGGDGKKTRQSCDADGDCTGGVCFEQECYTACTDQGTCAEDELCVSKPRGDDDVTLCVVAADFAPCGSLDDCSALVPSACQTVACDADGVCGFDEKDDGTTCDGPDRPGFCQMGTCVTGDTCPNGACTAGETCENCPEDCCAACQSVADCADLIVPQCYAAFCGDDGECGLAMATDGAACQFEGVDGECHGGACYTEDRIPCGDGVCNPDDNETCLTCSPDCGCPTGQTCSEQGACEGGGASCGDGACAPSEDCVSCPGDCEGCVAGYLWTFDDGVMAAWSADLTADPWVGTLQVEVVDGGPSFLGPFGKQTVTLTVGSTPTFAILPGLPAPLPAGPLPAHDTVRLTFDLYVLGSWDGHAATTGSTFPSQPDLWTWGVPAIDVGHSFSFSNCVEDVQSYPDDHIAGMPLPTNAAKFGAVSSAPIVTVDGCGDAIYRLTATFGHTADTLEVLFLANLNEYPGSTNLANESWGLDNVKVELLCQACGS